MTSVNRVEPSAAVGGRNLDTPAEIGRAVPIWRSLAVLFKLRVVALLLVAAVAGAFLAAGGWPGAATLIVLLVAGCMSASGASAINQYLERELDARMQRTSARPLASSAFGSARWVPYASALMVLVPSLAILPFNPPLAVFILLGAAIYIGVYTIWLKPRTPLNIVIGGAAGSAAVLSGSAASGTWYHPGALLLALLVFVWTPTHFWSLAIAYREDYARGGFPMLPVQSKSRTAAVWVLGHTCAAITVGLVLATDPALGWAYLIPVALASAYFLVCCVRLLDRQGRKRALAAFVASNLYLAVAMIMVCVSTLLH